MPESKQALTVIRNNGPANQSKIFPCIACRKDRILTAVPIGVAIARLVPIARTTHHGTGLVPWKVPWRLRSETSGLQQYCSGGKESVHLKEVLAHYIYDHSDRSEKPLITVNCAAFPENLIEAELFGYEKGSFTGASKDGKMGLVEAADEGTLFLDEINSLPINVQGKLLRTLSRKKHPADRIDQDKESGFPPDRRNQSKSPETCRTGEIP